MQAHLRHPSNSHYGCNIGGGELKKTNNGYFCGMNSTSLTHVDRTDELYKLHYLLEEHGRVLLLGVAGIGKSQLVRDYTEFFDSDYRHQMLTLSFSEAVYTEVIAKAQLATVDSHTLVILDDLDKFRREDRERALQFIKTSRRLPIRIVIVGRGNEPELAPFLSVGISMRLYGLTHEQVLQLTNELKWKTGLTEESVALYVSLAQKQDGNPTLIHELFESLVVEDELTIEVIGNDSILNQLHYRRDIIQTPLINDIKVVDQELTKIIAKDPKAVYSFTSRKFEELVAEVFDKLGYDVTLTQATRDGGSDLYLLENKGFGQLLYFVECKRNNTSRPVGVSVVRQLNGVIDAKNATAGIVVTSSHFTKPAEEFQKSIEYKMNLVNYAKLLQLINSLKR